MCRELEWLGQSTSEPLETLYFGGGTPSLLSPMQIAQIVNTCRQAFTLIPTAEITLEANPESIDQRYLEQLRNIGINRLSIGMQSAHANELRLFARQHDTNTVAGAVKMARCAGFDNISLDLIYGTPHQTLDSWRESVEAALALAPDHLSLYSLILEPDTALTRSVERGWLPKPDDDLAADMYDLADTLVTDAGLQQYEISTWARSGAMCQHNLHYWHNLPYLGAGAGAHGYAGNLRYEVVRSPQQYIDLAMQQSEPLPFPLTPTVEHTQPIDLRESMAEHMITGLRLLNEGVSLTEFEHRFGLPLDHVYGSALDQLLDYGMLIRENDSIKLTSRARLVSNQVFMRFMPD
jgi:oxygen-independent coproporphyrinogen-3 oxidase